MDFSAVDLQQLYFRKTIGSDMGEVSMDGDMVRLLLAIDENKDVAAIGRETGMSPVALTTTLKKLMNTGLIEPVQQTGPSLDAAFVEQVRIELAKAVGPIGNFLIDDVAAALKIDINSLPISQAPEFVVNLAREIPDREKRLTFQKAMKAML